MGLLQKYKDYQENRRIKKRAKCLKTIKNPKAIREDRVLALDYMAKLDSWEEAVPVLLQRFEYSLEHGINDTREKETAMAGILKHGSASLDLITQHLKQTSKIAWPIKILFKIASEEQMVAILLSCLDFGEVSLDQEKVDKNYDILCYLRDHNLDDPKKVFHFLDAHDERVRFATVEILLNYDDKEIRNKLEPLLSDGTPENTRLRQAVVEKFAEKSWVVTDPGKLTNAGLPQGVYLNQKNQLVHS